MSNREDPRRFCAQSSRSLRHPERYPISTALIMKPPLPMLLQDEAYALLPDSYYFFLTVKHHY